MNFFMMGIDSEGMLISAVPEQSCTKIRYKTRALLRVNNQKTERCFFRAKKYIPAVNYCKTVYNS